jgi:hypothetical protein
MGAKNFPRYARNDAAGRKFADCVQNACVCDSAAAS